MITNQTLRFSEKVGYYSRYRPSYPNALYTLLQQQLCLNKESKIADIGSGTGISAEPFLSMDCEVFGIEPNDEMRFAAEHSLSSYRKFRSICATAEHTGLDSSSVDLIIAAQSFHWFNVHKVRDEFRRILNPDGCLALVWNTRKSGIPLMDEYEQLLQDYGTDYKEITHINDSNIKLMFGKNYEQYKFEHIQVFDFEGFKGRLLSNSYIPMATDNRFSLMLNELQSIFNRHQSNGKIHFEMETVLFFGKMDQK